MHRNKLSGPVDKQPLVLLRGGGDLASGVALRLQRAGIRLAITELAQPLAVRRAVSFAETVYEGRHAVEGVPARLVKAEQLPAALKAGEIPVLIDPDAQILTKSQSTNYQFRVVVDARLTKQPPAPLPIPVPLLIGLGPGFHAGVNCDAAIETRRGHTLGRVYWDGPTQPDSGQPEGDPRRVLRAPSDGILSGKAKIGEHIEEGQVIAVVSEQRPVVSEQYSVVSDQYSVVSEQYSVVSPFSGVLRGLIRDGVQVSKDLKIGDVDPRDDVSACFLVSDKALAVGGAVLEAILTRAETRQEFFTTTPSIRGQADTKEHKAFKSF